MTDWAWDYNPSAEYVTGGLPPGAMAEVERIATEPAALGHDCRSRRGVEWAAGSNPAGVPTT
ncbi:hypothetical protein [Streptomyces fulvoviolaceus]|uniref:hypothetical protein n=1 Tax=Streptomyces fulvoviolaceus TaxID=285535 RepID=UPI000AF8D6A1|nr:hypothetical protein [Streptomyces fulvoviolaceus]MCT9084587.1 hypothetical protein [Streptomyces fulvoviolaceus]